MMAWGIGSARQGHSYLASGLLKDWKGSLMITGAIFFTGWMPNSSTYCHRWGPKLGLVCMYVCLKIYIRRALSKKVTVVPRSQTNRNVFSARLNRLVDKSAEHREDRRLFQILASATAKLRSPNVLLVRRTTNIAVSDDRSVRRPESAMSWQSSARYGGNWPSSDLWISSASLNSTRC